MKMLDKKIALVTGAGSGIGRAIALQYAAAGAGVVVSDIDEKAGKATLSQIKAAGGRAFFIAADTSSVSDQEKLVKETVKKFGALHIACNNAGIAGMMAPTGEYPPENWDKVIAINLSGVFYGMRFQIPEMLKAGGGSIVNIASILGQVATRFAPAYVAAKHGVVGLSKAAALEYADKNIRVNAVGPGYIITPLLTAALNATQMQSVAELHPVGRLGLPEEVAELVVWLSSDKASFVTGSYYPVDGGYLSQ